MLTTKEIKKQIELGNINIKNLSYNALSKPNSCDLRIGNTLYTFDYDIIDTKNSGKYLDEVLNDKIDSLRRVSIPETGFLLQPHKVYLAKTIEEVSTCGFVPVLNGKTMLSLLGVSVELTSGYKVDNFNGSFILSIIATKPTIIYPDIKIANLTFFPSLKTSQTIKKINDDMSCGVYTLGMLSGEEIKKRMQGENPDIIIDPKDKIVLNPNSVNLTLNDIVGIYSDPVLDMKKDNAVKKIKLGDDGIWFYPDEIYLGRTNEWTETNNLVPMLSGRSSLGRNGLHVHCSAGMGSIGYKGYWHMGIRAVKPIKVVKDMKCCQIYYLTADGDNDISYHGYMQNLSKEELGSPLYKSLIKKYRKDDFKC